MTPLIQGLLVGAALGMAKDKLVDTPKRQAAQRYQAITAGLSPWTGIQPQMPVDTSGDATLQGAVAGAQMGQQYGQAEGQQDLVSAQTALINRMMAANPEYMMPSQDFSMLPQGSMASLRPSTPGYMSKKVY